MRTVLALAVLLACDSGPSEEELAAARAEKSCGKVYSSLTKVLRDELYKGGVAEVAFGEKAGFVEKCVAASLSDEQLRCLDPNLGGTDACKEAMKPVAAKTTELHEFLLAPMRAAPDEGGEEVAGEGGG